MNIYVLDKITDLLGNVFKFKDNSGEESDHKHDERYYTKTNVDERLEEFKKIQTAKSDPSASGTSLTAIATITQNANGEITATKKTIQDATTGQKGVMKVGTGLSASSGTVSVSYGTASGTACQGNDSRLSDSRTPKSHTHGNITNDGKLTNTAVTPASGDSLPIVDSSASGSLVKSSIVIGTGTTKYLREDGAWGTPSGMDVVWIDSTDTVDGYTSTKNALDSGKLPCTRYGGKIYICISAGAEGEFSGGVNFVSVDNVGAHCLLCNGYASQTGHYCDWALVDYGFKTKQTAKSDPSASGTSLTAIATITQNANGEITATKKTIQDATTGQKGVMKVGTGLSASSGTVSVSYGTASGTACQGNDSRLSDSRTPKSHNHAASEITSGTLSVARGGTGQTSVANIQAGKDGSGNTITSTYLPQSGKSVLKNSVTSTLKGAVLVPWNATANIAISTLINQNCGVQAGVDGTVYVILNIGANTKTITGFAGSSTSWELVKGTCMTCVRYAGSYYREDN